MNSPYKILCSYINSTNKLQIIRLANSQGCSFHRVVFPGERFLFESPLQAELEVQTSYLGQAVLVTRIPSRHLKVKQG